MAAEELTGATEEELKVLEGEHYNSPLYLNHGVPFEVAYCLVPIGKQPDDYDGPQRYCTKRASKKEGTEPRDYREEAYAMCCRFHGGDAEKRGEYLHCPYTTPIKHGAYADDEHLKMDFDDDEQELYDQIMEEWPEIYDWPPRSEDPARYRILRRVAVNEVRALREEEYIDGEEVQEIPITDDQGVEVGSQDIENPLLREYRLLMSEVTDQMKELGLTPKEQQKMDTLESQADKDDALTEIASDALDSDDGDYDPNQFDD